MEENVGTIDRGLRFLLSLCIFILGAAYQTWFGLLGFIPLITSIMKWCPLYSIFKINSCKKD